MADTETVFVQPLTSYQDQGEIKHASSSPYRATRPHAQDLTGNGFARVVEDASEQVPDMPDDPEPDVSAIDRPRGRRARD